jgi:hypothetical protein
MKNLPLFEIYKIKDDNVVHTYKIYINGDVEGFNEDGFRYGISNNFPHFCRVGGISMAAFSPSMATREEASPSSNPKPE